MKEKRLDNGKMIKWVIAVGIPLVLYGMIPQSESVSPEMRKFFVCTAWAILTWEFASCLRIGTSFDCLGNFVERSACQCDLVTLDWIGSLAVFGWTHTFGYF